MTVSREQILKIIYTSIDEVNEQLDDASRIPKTETALLLGESGSLDSLAFVNFVALIEEKCESTFGMTPALTGDGATTEEENPFETVGKLADFVAQMLGRQQSG